MCFTGEILKIFPLNCISLLTLKVPLTKAAEFSNSIDPDEVAHHEPPHQDLHCFSSSLQTLIRKQLEIIIIEMFADVHFVVSFFALKELMPGIS